MFRRINGRLVNTVAFGSGDLTVLGVGGWIGSWEVWQQPFELLSDSHRVIAYDHYGSGETHVPLDELTFENHVEAVFGVLDTLSVGRCVLAGESNGGAVAIAAAARAPQRFGGLVLVSSAYCDFDQPINEVFATQLRADFERTIAGFVELCVPEPDSDHLRRWLRDILLRAEPEEAVRLIECMKDVDLRPQLRALELPTLIVHGGQDALPFTLPSVAEEAARLVPHSELRMLPDAGHVPTLTRPEQVAAAIRTFIDALA